MRWIAVLFIATTLMFASVTYAADRIISPIPDPDPNPIVAPIPETTPEVSFGDLLTAVPDTGTVLGISTTTAMAAEQFGIPDIFAISAPATPAASPSPQPKASLADTRSTKKRAYTITLVGDSMIDTLGPIGGGLPSLLNRTYPSPTFTVINHGVGAENIDSGVRRLTNGYSYLGLGRNSVVSERPDVVVIESFGYNPYPLPDINDALTKHWLKLAEMVDTIHRELPETKIIIAATIAPNWDVFGDGAPFINFSTEGKRTKVEEIKKYIESTIAFAKSQGIPLADAYHPSLDSNGNGKLTYINAGDHIHYSDAGRALMAERIASAIVSNKLLE